MAVRKLVSLTTLVALFMFVGCSDPKPPPPAEEYATESESIAALNSLMADAFSVVAGVSASPVGAAFTGLPCLVCDQGLYLAPHLIPGVFLLTYKVDEFGNPTDFSLATGTFSYDSATDTGHYDQLPPDALVLQWADQHGRPVEIKFSWGQITRVKTTYYGLDWGYIYSHLPPELDVPGRVELTVKHDDNTVVDLQLDQTWVNTQCGRLLEFDHVLAKGYFSSGVQRIDVRELLLDHTTDNRLVLSLDAAITSGTINLPLQAAFEVQAANVSRDPATCQLAGVEAPLNGRVELAAGSGQSNVALRFGWNALFEGNDLSKPTEVRFDAAQLLVGKKRVDILGAIGLAGLDPEPVLKFKDVASRSLSDFVGKLTIPSP